MSTESIAGCSFAEGNYRPANYRSSSLPADTNDQMLLAIHFTAFLVKALGKKRKRRANSKKGHVEPCVLLQKTEMFPEE